MSEKGILEYGHHKIKYQIVFEQRKNLTISVLPSKEVQVKAPINGDKTEIKRKLQKKASWIIKQIRYFDQFHPIQQEREYVSGETHYFLGRQYRLRVRKGADETVKLMGKFFIVSTKDPAKKIQVRTLMREWYADHAKILFDERIKINFKKIPGIEANILKINYQYLRRQWGIKNANGLITFNIELIKTPIQCIDYVIIHELCHLVQTSNSDDYYQLLRNVIPDWQKRKERLEIFGAK